MDRQQFDELPEKAFFVCRNCSRWCHRILRKCDISRRPNPTDIIHCPGCGSPHKLQGYPSLRHLIESCESEMKRYYKELNYGHKIRKERKQDLEKNIIPRMKDLLDYAKEWEQNQKTKYQGRV